MRILLDILKRIGIFIAGIVITVISIALLFCFVVWATVPVYEFPEPGKFKGSEWYNPYEGLDSLNWYKANFHAHCKKWGGITNGKDNTSTDVFEAYRELGYEFATLSNYQSITEKAECGFPYVPAQEYGINLLKTHLLLIGSRAPVYIDQPFIQGVNTKQHRINKNREDNEVIVLAHPSWGNGFTKRDMKRLGGYDLIEVLNHFKNSIEYWDIALSTGHPAFLLASDDTHNVFKNSDLSRKITMVPHSAEYADFIYSTLRNGATYGINATAESIHEPREAKVKRIDSYPKPISISESGDTVRIALSSKVAEIRFIGDGGEILKKENGTSSSFFAATENQSYIRIEADTEDGSLLLFNPLLRSEDGSKPEMPQISKSVWKSNTKTAILILGLIIVYLYVRRKVIRTRKKR